MQKEAKDTASGLAAQGKAVQLAEPLGTTAREACHWVQPIRHIFMQLAKDVTSDTSICWDAAKVIQVCGARGSLRRGMVVQYTTRPMVHRSPAGPSHNSAL